MKLFVFAISLVFNCVCAFSQNTHELMYAVGCFYNGTTEVKFEYNDDLVFYIDFQNSAVVYTTPSFLNVDLSEFENLYRNAMKAKRTCLGLLTYLKTIENDPPEQKDPPESVLYTAEEVQIGVENHLICLVNHFYPPSIRVSWSKNNHPVTEGVFLSPNYPNTDQTFHQFTSLTFTPKQGDMYSCTVEHSALKMPKTRIWEVDLNHRHPALDIYCGVGLTVGFLGVATGTFLIVKGRYSQTF